MKLLVDEDTASATLLAHLRAAEHELVHVPVGTLDATVFRKRQGGESMPKVLRLEWTLPDEAFGEGFDEGSFLTQVKEEVVMRLLQARRISQGKAAELLGIDRYALVDLMARYAIPVTDVSPEELTQEFARADALFRG